MKHISLSPVSSSQIAAIGHHPETNRGGISMIEMSTELEKARAAQQEAFRRLYGEAYPEYEDTLEGDYALLEATKAAIESQTVPCDSCIGGKILITPAAGSNYETTCPACKGRGRIPTEEGLK